MFQRSKKLNIKILFNRPDKFQGQKLIIMKKIIISLSVAGFISLGFTVVGNTSSSRDEHVKIEQNNSSEQFNASIDFSDKRLASWD